MRVLVTGASGFVGKHLVTELSERGHEVFAGSNKNVSQFQESVKIVHLDVMDSQALLGLMKKIKPEGIIHLAAQSMVTVAWENPRDTFLVNTIGTLNLIDAVMRIIPTAKVISVGSSEEYGFSGILGESLTEECPCLPHNPYATSKLAQGQAVIQLARKYGLHLIHARPFNHFGPGQREGFVVSDFCSQVARLENSTHYPIIEVGDLSANRDFTDVRDVVNAYSLLLENEIEHGIYNVCSGVPRTIEDILNLIVSNAKVPFEIRTDVKRLRPSEIPLFVGSANKIQDATGWKQKRNFEGSVLETLEWWRGKQTT